MMKIYAYLRVSATDQKDSGAGISAQEDACVAWASFNKNVIQKFYLEEGVSGSLPLRRRSVLQEAIANLKKSDVLLVAKRDRIGRDVANVIEIEKAIKDKGAKLISVSGEGTNSNTSYDVFMRGALDLFAQHERNIIRERTKDALQAKKARGERAGGLPYGYGVCEDGVHLKKCDKEQKVIDMVMQLRGEKLSIRNVAKKLNSEGMYNRRESPWTHDSVYNICKNNGMIGENKYGRNKLEEQEEEQRVLILIRNYRTTGKTYKEISEILNHDKILNKHGRTWVPSSVRYNHVGIFLHSKKKIVQD